MRKEIIAAFLLTTGLTLLDTGCSSSAKLIEPPIIPSTPVLFEPTGTVLPTIVVLTDEPTKEPTKNLPTPRPVVVDTATITSPSPTPLDRPSPFRDIPTVRVTPTEVVSVMPQLGDIVSGISPKVQGSSSVFLLLRQGVGLVQTDEKTFQRVTPPAALHTQYNTQDIIFRPPEDNIRTRFAIDESRKFILSVSLDMLGRPTGPVGTVANADKFHKISGIAVSQNGRLGIASEGTDLLLWETSNSHHQGTLVDNATKAILSQAAGVYWIGWGNGELDSDGFAGILNKDQTVTIYRINPLAYSYKEEFSPDDQKSMNGAIHTLSDTMMKRNRENPQRKWIPYATLSISEAELLLAYDRNTFLVGK